MKYAISPMQSACGEPFASPLTTNVIHPCPQLLSAAAAKTVDAPAADCVIAEGPGAGPGGFRSASDRRCRRDRKKLEPPEVLPAVKSPAWDKKLGIHKTNRSMANTERRARPCLPYSANPQGDKFCGTLVVLLNVSKKKRLYKTGQAIYQCSVVVR